MPEEAKEQVETVEVDGVQIPKHIHEKIVNGVQMSMAKRSKKELASVVPMPEDMDIDKAKMSDITKVIKEQFHELSSRRIDPEDEKDKTSKIEAKIRAQYEQKEQEFIAGNQKRSAMNDVRNEAILMGLSDEFKDLEVFNALFRKHFDIDLDKEDIIYKDIAKDMWVVTPEGRPAAPNQIASKLKESYPSAFVKVKEGLGRKGDYKVMVNDQIDYSKMATEDLLNQGFKNTMEF